MFRLVVGTDHELQPHKRRGVGDAPAVGVEHRHDGQHDGERRQVENIRSDDRHRMKHGRAVLVEHAFGVSGGAASVAEAARIALVALVPAIVAVLGGQPIVEFAVEADVMLDRRPARLHSFDQWREGGVVEEHAVLAVVDDIFELVVEQPRIERVEDSAHSDHAKPGGQVTVVIHRQRADAVTRANSGPLQRLRHSASVMRDADPVRANDRAIGAR